MIIAAHSVFLPLGAPASVDTPERPAIPLDNDWFGQPGWDTDSQPYSVVDVDVTDDDPATADPGTVEANLLLPPNKPQTLAAFLAAHEIDSQLRLCTVAKEALDNPSLPMFWDDEDNNAGWFKGASQVMQTMVFGVGAYDTCTAAP